MSTETYDSAELLRELPLVQDVKPHHLHMAPGREPLVVTNGDLRQAFPVLGEHGAPKLFPLPLGRLRRLLQAWPDGERVNVWRGALCPLNLRKRHRYEGFKLAESWWDPVEPTQPRRFIELSGGSFRCRLYEPERYEYRVRPGTWTWRKR